ncbi:hypothetical protein [Streptomyces mirabilis]|uniref:hypothetical protein n=1 Tax=Streptomyces mirabilis TaxID=68239 RepID=UPI00368383B6
MYGADCQVCGQPDEPGPRVDAAVSVGNETLDRAGSVTDKLSSKIAERARRWWQDEEKHNEEG